MPARLPATFCCHRTPSDEITGGTIGGNITGAGPSDTLNFALASRATYTTAKFAGLNRSTSCPARLFDGTDSATNIDVLSGATLGGTGTSIRISPSTAAARSRPA